MANVNDNQTMALCACLEDLISLKQYSDDTYFQWMPGGTIYRKENLEYQRKTIIDLKTIYALGSKSQEYDIYVDGKNFMETINTLPNDKKLWDVYLSVLKKSTFPNQRKITEEEKQKVEKLEAEQAKWDEVFKQYSKAYKEALKKYNKLRADAMKSEEAALDFALNGTLYQEEVDEAMQDWVSLGHKGSVESAKNELLNIHRETSESWINELLNRMDKNLVAGDGPLYHSYLGIKDIFDETLNWTELTVDSTSMENIDSKSKHRYTQNRESASGMWFWKSRSSQSSHGTSAQSEQTDKLAISKISFKFLQVPIHRPWLDATIIECGAWKWTNPDMDPLSTGGDHPTGDMVAYPTTAIFVKDLSVEIDNVSVLDRITDSTSTTQYNSVGPFRLFRKRENTSRTETNESHIEVSKKDKNEGTLTNPSVQLIGFRCHQLEKTPSL